ncbi:hypothetical protein KSP39_PZI009802 [Platanthera zijinensis]|uniref:(S)-ureidoglycine aminohydrolase cupin domain-containing protein n=1 Tax=Platanthera zijinensis TaxID=2320716 RepID=A0AAP0G6X1_9ASPA
MASSSSNADDMDSDSSNLLISVERNPPPSRLADLGIKSWPNILQKNEAFLLLLCFLVQMGLSSGKFPLKFDAKQTCYLLKGKVKAYIKGSAEFVEFGAGDLVTIPKGLSCTWDVSVSVDKHYKFYSS